MLEYACSRPAGRTQATPSSAIRARRQHFFVATIADILNCICREKPKLA